MARATAARRSALSLVSERRRRDARARELLRASDELSALSERERAQATRLVLGTVAAEGELDRVIDAHLRRGARLEPRVRDALRLAAFELLYLGTRDDVCVSQGVELVRGVSPRAAGLANAVLRRVAEKDAPALSRARGRVVAGAFDARDLARVGALPEWLCARALASLGDGRAAAWAVAALAPAAPAVAANRARWEDATRPAACSRPPAARPRRGRWPGRSRSAPPPGSPPPVSWSAYRRAAVRPRGPGGRARLLARARLARARGRPGQGHQDRA